jgi:uncharacterized protein YceK
MTTLPTKMVVFKVVLTSLCCDVRSLDPTQPGNPDTVYSAMFDWASARLTGVRTCIEYE